MKDIKKEKYYSGIFKKITSELKYDLNRKYGIEIISGKWLDSVVIKLFKKKWMDKTTGSSIFFSVWIEDKCLNRNKIYYNIHALKLRQLKGYKIESIKFAGDFRKMFNEYVYLWQNVSMSFGPGTLLQGNISLNEKTIEKDISELIFRFLKIEFIIDEVLEKWKK
ncbi:MAG TPA: hypothetical protein PKC91_08240 [Ignavibacteria bacterium]|nr:hypothetical protein [Ignavibacteria bacterium]